jgi:hypothetical protein
MYFDTEEAPGAYDCPKCGATPVAYASVGAHGKVFYYVRCESCGMAGSSGPSVDLAVKFWNGQGVFDGER